MNIIFGDKKSRTWFITAVSLIAFFLIVTILAETVFFELFEPIFGKRRIEAIGSIYYESDYDDKEDSYAKANALNEKICEEGFVLLKNGESATDTSDDILPLDENAKISVFGKNSVNIVLGGSGSGAASSEGAKTIYDSLTDAGFVYNDTLKSFYESSASGAGRSSNPAIDNQAGILTGFGTGETPQSSYTQTVKDSYAQFNDAALVIFSRIGGESFDLPRSMINTPGAASENDHYLELDQNEQDLLVAVTAAFEKVIVIINSSTSMELGFLDAIVDGDETQSAQLNSSEIGAAIWIGGPGTSGIMALGRILNGEVNPSGRTVDTYQRDFTKDPTYVNFSTNAYPGSQNVGDKYIKDVSDAGFQDRDLRNKEAGNFVDYEEGIYMGYRYYETRGLTDGETWYENNVVFPFGYGLSYTTFDWEITATSPAANSNLTFDTNKNCEISVTVTVTNTGSVAGKDVVQIYVTAPYTAGQIEKAHVVLVNYAKTGVIEPGDSEDVTITFDAYDFASYDWNDANNNNFKGYELDAGLYEIKAMKNAHDVIDSFQVTVASNVQYSNDTTTNTAVSNLFEDVSTNAFGLQTVLSRADWTGTWPATRTTAEKTISADFLRTVVDESPNNPIYTQSGVTMPNQSEFEEPMGDLQLYQVIKTNPDDSPLYDENGVLVVDYNDPLWDELLDLLTIDQMMTFISEGAFKTGGIDTIGKLPTGDYDGPVGFVLFMSVMNNPVYQTCSYASECVIGAMWNQEMAYAMGLSVGNEATIGNERADRRPYSGWYAPAINLHRTPFSGRNFEYYSEDARLNGLTAAQVIKGCATRGVYTQTKHFAVNDQETHRSGVCTWLTEQTLREVYLKPFEIAVKDGHSMGMMSSFNRIGTRWTGGDYVLLTKVLREEWGFQGMVICDFNTESFMNSKQMAYAGGDLNLTTQEKDWDATTAADVTVLRQCTKNILFTVARSNGMNGTGEGAEYVEKLAYWEIALICFDVALVAGMAAWGFFAIKGAAKRRKEIVE